MSYRPAGEKYVSSIDMKRLSTEELDKVGKRAEQLDNIEVEQMSRTRSFLKRIEAQNRTETLKTNNKYTFLPDLKGKGRNSSNSNNKPSSAISSNVLASSSNNADVFDETTNAINGNDPEDVSSVKYSMNELESFDKRLRDHLGLNEESSD